MKSIITVLFITLGLFFIHGGLPVSDANADQAGEGEKLVRQLWDGVKNNDMKMLAGFFAKGFQSVHRDGARNRSQELELIKGVNINDYALKNIQATQNGPVIVVTYTTAVEETIDGKRLNKAPAPRMSVFVKTDTGWKLVAHANLRPLK